MIRKLMAFLALAVAYPGAALAAQPQPWQLDLQPAADERMSQIIGLHDFLLVIITLISLFVLALLAWVAIRYNARSNPVPTATTHNTLLEVAWTVIPVLILTVIAVPSFRILYFQETIPKYDLTVKAIGKQWFWTYEYPDAGFTFDALMLPDSKAAELGEPRLLGTDNHIVVPVNKVVRLITTGADVIHAWTIPAFGVKIDAVPGKINQTWFKPNKEGIYYGQCSELCGARHAFMPIEVEVVSQARYDAWLAQAKEKFAATEAPTRLAAAQ